MATLVTQQDLLNLKEQVSQYDKLFEEFLSKFNTSGANGNVQFFSYNDGEDGYGSFDDTENVEEVESDVKARSFVPSAEKTNSGIKIQPRKRGGYLGSKTKNTKKRENSAAGSNSNFDAEDEEHTSSFTNFLKEKTGSLLEEPNCPSAWNSFLPITYIPQAKRASNDQVICTDPFIKQLHDKPQIRLIVASQVAAWNVERSTKIQSDIFKSWQLRACLQDLPNDVFLLIDHSMRNTSDSARKLFNEFQSYYKLKNFSGLTFYWPHQGSKLKFLKEVTKLIKVVRYYFEPRPVKMILTADKVFLVGFPAENQNARKLNFDTNGKYNSYSDRDYKHHYTDNSYDSDFYG